LNINLLLAYISKVDILKVNINLFLAYISKVDTLKVNKMNMKSKCKYDMSRLTDLSLTKYDCKKMLKISLQRWTLFVPFEHDK